MQVGVEGAERARQLADQRGEARRLVLVRVPAAHVDSEGADADVHADDPCHRHQTASDLGIFVGGTAGRLIGRDLPVGQAQ